MKHQALIVLCVLQRLSSTGVQQHPFVERIIAILHRCIPPNEYYLCPSNNDPRTEYMQTDKCVLNNNFQLNYYTIRQAHAQHLNANNGIPK